MLASPPKKLEVPTSAIKNSAHNHYTGLDTVTAYMGSFQKNMVSQLPFNIKNLASNANNDYPCTSAPSAC